MIILADGLDEPTQILPGLWMGPKPREGDELRKRGFRQLVLCAMEHQPPANKFLGLKVNYCPLDDSKPVPPTPAEWRIACLAATAAAIDVSAGRPVLVTCMMGINRSGLVTALAAALVLNCSGAAAVELVRMMRPGALQKTAVRRPRAARVRAPAISFQPPAASFGKSSR